MHSPAEQTSADNSQLLKSPVNMKPNNRRKSPDKSRSLVFLPPETLSDVTEGSRPATDASKIAKSALFGAQSSIRVKKSGDRKQKKEKTNPGKVRDRKELNHSDVKANKNDSGGKGSESLLAKPTFVQNILRSPSPKGERGNGLHSGISLPENDLRSKVKETGGTLKPRSKKSKEQSASSKLKQYNDEQQRAADRDVSSHSGEENLDAESDEITVSLTMEEFLFENAAQVEKLEPKTKMSMEEFLCESRVGTQTVADGIPF
ncbi:hypothetical protein SARC_00609 [Sphaeroforma arctica JP610]|uniref:Uncharacterized protein n=1 Tax=Sphaeroforma arctica JP610 TaxID=667725 RepID=A0A0L0GEG8_9EUKA|nr:hypothetical protein SARC_00609 [Sphaeroforma arctica JP610]KNC87281.1 hypothetical protein SARC_00609 [Sphaeroforma arctica JP610]|eukprot:XP_014161183.1 hypothetical protein SARC_00609 [Sphaeroforma arctica JP610]